MQRAAVPSLLAAILLTSCGRPDASGIYVADGARGVTLVQLVETKDGAITGRLEQVTIAPNGSVNDVATPIDGAASRNELVFKPTSAWFGGISASGSLSGNQLTITGAGFTIVARRSSLAEFQAQVADLQSKAGTERENIAAATARAAAARSTVETIARLEQAAAQLRNDTTRLNVGITNSPDFAMRAAQNTARIEEMVRRASNVDRDRLSVAANQVEVGTNQVEVARSQYAIGLNAIIQDATAPALQVQANCNAPSVQFLQSCLAAKTALADFKAAIAHGQRSFSPQKAAVQRELGRQDAMIKQIGE